MTLRSACLVGLLFVSSCGKKETRHARIGPMNAPAFWVWHRASPLKPAETDSLKQAGVRSLYWQAAECAWDGAWHMTRIAAPMMGTPEMTITPVFRIKPQPAFLGSPDAARSLAEEIRKWSGAASSPREIQLDFDCPDRLLGNYARFLRSLGKAISPTAVSITALAAWPRHPEFENLATSVSTLAPMFYDLRADNPADVKAGHFQAMADPSVAALIRLWSKCPRPWLAGLPNFERMSVFSADGKLAGHLRGWTHDSVLFHPGLKRHGLGEGVTIFETPSTVEVSGTELSPGGKLVHRMPDAAALELLVKAADQAGASGVLYFALPGPGIQAAFSPSHLAHASDAPRPLVEMGAKGTVVLKNAGTTDLPARVWELELHSAQTGAFRSASPGGFANAGSPAGIPAELSGTIILRFAKLPAGESIVSGPLVTNADGLSWSIRGVAENQPVISGNSAR